MEIIDEGLNLIQDLSGQKIVLFGGTGSVGEGILRSYLKTNAKIIVPSRSEKSKDKLLEILGEVDNSKNLDFIIGDYSTFQSAEEMAKLITDQYGSIDHVIACVGGWWIGGPFWTVSEEAWQNQFVGLATTHAALAKAWIPRLSRENSYQIISGSSGTHPVAKSGIVSMQHASLIMMAEVIALEAASEKRVFVFVLGVVNSRNRPAHKPYWITAEQVGMVSSILAKENSIPSQVIKLSDKAALPGVLDILEKDMEG
ncbi:SDR family NAD(P)-dependent oxidoreductase [Sphingobacterium lactis]|uniref:SDR family NAD(P)-dependent oxidoreductase n=1 Tax=Sphingobacterium lactis TaxID=797291 RepID=UPI003EC7E8B7